jgi:PAS domain S-box-containing protein
MKKSDRPRNPPPMSLEQYHRVVEEADEGFWIIDSEAVILYVNRSLARMLGSDPEDVLGRSAYEFLFDEDREAGGRAFAEYLGKRETSGSTAIAAVTGPSSGPG